MANGQAPQMAQLQRLGWEWHQNGVIIRVETSHGKRAVFVPLGRVWATFERELQAVGCPTQQAAVGAPFSVGGFFSFVKKAVSSAASAVKKVVPQAVQRAASNIVSTAKRYGAAAVHAIQKVPVLGSIATAAGALALLPANAANQLIQGRRIDRIAVDQFKSAIKNTRTLAPYVQTVVSFVPGIGQGVSAGLGGALALASGAPISEAMLEAVKSALPGGPLAQAAFSIATSAIQGKDMNTALVGALPISNQQKGLLLRGISAAKDLAHGKPVSQIVIDQATQSLPPELQKAVAIGVAMGHAKSLQQAVGTAASNAMHLTNLHNAGLDAARQWAGGARSSALEQAMQRAVVAKQTTAQLLQHAAAGNNNAAHFVRAFHTMNVANRASPSAPFGLFRH
jgi:uncharacterized protein YbjQ (UPF0145 family)